MLAVHRFDQTPRERTLLEVVREFIRFHDEPQVGIPYETRQELKRRHFADLREAAGVAPAKSRAGSTLTEVLVALLIFSIGAVSVITMFPLSVLRAAKATQLTHATDLRFNAEALIDLYPSIVSDPDLDRNLLEHVNPNLENYIIDPYGRDVVLPLQGVGPVPTNAHMFFGITGNAANQPPNPLLTNNAAWTIPRYHLNRAGALAHSLVTLPDSWEVLHEGNATAPIPVAGPTQLDVTGLQASGTTFTAGAGLTYRAVIFNADRTQSHVRNITQMTADTIYWTEDTDGSGPPSVPVEDVNANGAIDQHVLPATATFTPAIVRIESQEQRYTWMLTVRKIDTYGADVDMVVFFKRSVDNPVEQEAVFPATFSTTVISATVNPTTVEVNYTPGGLVPNAKRGGYIFDADNARWYRISNVTDNGTGTMTVRIETLTILDSPAAGGHAMFPKAVVEVYPLGTKAYNP